jgi:PAS domain S-box-containing protein
MSERPALREHDHLSENLYQLATQLHTAHTPTAILELLLKHAQQALSIRNGLAVLVQDDRWQSPIVQGNFAALSPTELSHLNTTLLLHVQTNSDPVVFLQLQGQEAQILLPLRTDERLLGFLALHPEDGSGSSPAQLRYLHKLVLHGATAIAGAQLLVQLQHSEARYRRLVDESPIGIAAGFLDGGLTEANDAYLKLLGFTREAYERGELDWAALTPPEYHAVDAAAFQRAFNQGTSGHYEKEMLTSTGERIPLEVILLQYAEGDRQRVVGYLRDLRAQRAAEAHWRAHTHGLQDQLDDRSLTLAQQAESLRQQRAELEVRTRVLEGFASFTRELTLDLDPYALIRRAQQFTLTLLPAQAFAVYYEPHLGLWRVKAQMGEVGNGDLQAALERGLPFKETTNLFQPWQTQMPLYQEHYDSKKDTVIKETTQLQSTATLPLSVREQPRGIFAIGLNVAQPWTHIDKVVLETVLRSLSLALERAEQTQLLQQRSLALEHSNRELEQFAYVASHDLQEPLRTVTSFSQLLVKRLGKVQEDPKVTQYSELIMDATGRMRTLIEDLLEFSRVGSREEPLRPTDLGAVLAQVQADLQYRLGETQGQLTFGELPWVFGDPAQLRQVFQNLINNALKFHAPGRSPQVSISAERMGEWIQVKISDNGIGIDPTHFERIFTVFQRLHRRDEYAGNGIGLAIVRKIMDRHGGSIEVSSVINEGTTFTMNLRSVEQIEPDIF